MFEDHCCPKKQRKSICLLKRTRSNLLDLMLLEVLFEHLRIFLGQYDKQLVHLKEAGLPYVCQLILERYNRLLATSLNPRWITSDWNQRRKMILGRTIPMFTQAVDNWVKTESSSISDMRFNSFLENANVLNINLLIVEFTLLNQVDPFSIKLELSMHSYKRTPIHLRYSQWLLTIPMNLHYVKPSEYFHSSKSSTRKTMERNSFVIDYFTKIVHISCH